MEEKTLSELCDKRNDIRCIYFYVSRDNVASLLTEENCKYVKAFYNFWDKEEKERFLSAHPTYRYIMFRHFPQGAAERTKGFIDLLLPLAEPEWIIVTDDVVIFSHDVDSYTINIYRAYVHRSDEYLRSAYDIVFESYLNRIHKGVSVFTASASYLQRLDLGKGALPTAQTSSELHPR